MALVRSYFSLLKEYQNKYGPKTFLLMQVGSFFEVYSEKEDDETMCAFSKMCDLKIASKGEHFMAGFRDYILDKYISKMNDNNYTTVVFIQEEVAGIIQRREYAVYSPGTTFLDDEIRLSNNTSCLWIHKTKRTPCTILFGISNLDIYTGKVDVFEYQEMYYHNPTTYDSIERFISIYKPTEMIVIHNMEEVIINGILQYLSMKSKKMTLVDLNKDDIYSNQASNCEKQPYQAEIIKKFYPLLNKGLVMDTLFEKAIAFQSLCFLLVYVSQHNPSLTHKLCEPILDKSTSVILANHSLKQLNMIDGEYTGDYSSVLSLLNTCRTKIGKREFQRILLNPVHDSTELQESYDRVEHCIKMNYDWSSTLSKLCDIEKINRKIILEKTTPSEYAQLYETCCLLENIRTDDIWNKCIMYDKVKEEIECVKKNLSSYLNLDVSRKTNDLDDTCDNLIRRGVDDSLDRTCRDKIEGRLRFNSICDYLNNLYKGLDKKCEQAFKVHETDKSGISIHITKKRKLFIQRHLETEVTLTFYSSYTENNETFTFKPSLLEFKEYNSQTYSLYSKELSLVNEQIIINSQEFLINLIRVYKKIHLFMNISYVHLIHCIQKMDVMNTKCEITKKYNYSKPILVKSDKSFLNAKKLRHALIEHLDKNEAYIPNDICLGKETQGILLFGTNAVGKTSLIKSIGICIIMAQSGLYVPCSNLEYSPYEYLFTRIIGNDNIFKGLSTFSVEMSELRVILQKCNGRSLILGDELCSGTEIDSALSIFISGVEHMYLKESSFIFATHFHTLQNFKEIKEMKGLALKHLTVQYNQEIKKLVYGRTLQDGAGESVYGLEVCKALMLSDEFLKRAYEIRNKYCNKPSILTMKQSSYNKDKIRGFCEFCKENMGTEIHHLKYQKDSVNSHIDTMPVDHPSNLASICETCHKHIHALNLVYEKKKNMEGGYSIVLTPISTHP
jgi:DNA mismatch repair protein MutS